MKKITKAIIKKRQKRKEKAMLKEAWRITRFYVLNRDNWTCQKCEKDLKNVKASNRNIHHVLPRQYKTMFFDEQNLITLCASCHHFSKESPHQNALLFSYWFMNKFPNRYNYLINKI